GARLLRRWRWPTALVALTTLLGFFLVLGGIVAALVPAIVDEFGDLGPTLEEAVDDLEDWLVEDSPFDISRRDIEDFRESARDWASDNARARTGAGVSRPVLAVEGCTGDLPAPIGTS